MQRGRMAIVNAETIEYPGKVLDVFLHILPQPGIILRRRAIPKLDAIFPDNYFAPKIRLGGQLGEVL